MLISCLAPLPPCRYQHLGDMMSLGQLNAAVALPISLPPVLQQSLQSSPLGGVLQLAGVQLGEKVTLEGPLAAALRRAAYLYRQPTNEQRVSVAASWVAQAAEVGPKILQQVLGSGAGQPGQPGQERS
jgi:NADH:ubiquinone reductase (non-electrogenic)